MIEFLDGTRETVKYREHFGIRLYMNEVPHHYPLHWHTAAEIIMPLENEYTATVDGIRYDLHPGDLLLIAPGELHELHAPESGKRIILLFDYGLLYNLGGFDTLLTRLRPCRLIASGDANELQLELGSLVQAIADEYMGAKLLREAQAYSLLIQFMVNLGRLLLKEERIAPPAERSMRQRDIDRFMRVCRYIREHCTDDLSAEEAAKEAGLSKFHFIRQFKQFTGLTYTRYLNEQRIMLAERLLIDPQASITEVAMRSGFGSLATFNRVFKTHKKCTPSEYQRLHAVHRE